MSNFSPSEKPLLTTFGLKAPDNAGQAPDPCRPGGDDLEILASIVGRRAAAGLLEKYPLTWLLKADRASLLSLPHVGPARADAILALPLLVEKAVQATGSGTCVSCSRDIFNRFRYMLGLKERENFIVLTLNTRNVITFEEVVAVGTVNSVHVAPVDILRPAVRLDAASIICLHNHPSGDPTPSSEDRSLTDRIARACTLLGIRFLDHLIISTGSYYSFSDAGEL